MSKKTVLELKTQINADIKVNGNREITPPKHNSIETNIIDSFLNFKDGGLLVEQMAGYLTEVVLSYRKAFAHVGYVDDRTSLISSNGFLYWTQGANPLAPVTGDVREGMVGTELQLQEYDTPDLPGDWAVRSTR